MTTVPPAERTWRSLALVAAGAAAALACGPNFPNRLLLLGDDAALSAPSAVFEDEIAPLIPAGPPRWLAARPTSSLDVRAQSAEVDAAELAEALADDPERAAVVVPRYAALRPRLAEPGLTTADLPVGLPPEFDAYARGLIAYLHRDLPTARRRWLELLAAPAAERGRRSTWAAFMLGKSWLGSDPARAVAWFRRTRELADAGFDDALGLASSSLGWEARAALDAGDAPRAIGLYLEQAATGDATAMNSLRLVAGWALGMGTGPAIARPRELLGQLARAPAARRVVTAYLIARGGHRFPPPAPEAAAAWLAAIEREARGPIDGSDRLAWAAYQAGDVATAARWLDVATPTDASEAAPALAQWLRAKLLLRAGRLDEAAAMLASVSRMFPPEETWLWSAADGAPIAAGSLALGESGAILMARRQYAEALDALVRGGFWCDAAYVAERVLTLDELQRYVDGAWPAEPEGIASTDGASSAADDEDAGDPAFADGGEGGSAWRGWRDARSPLRELLGRRLARARRYPDAIPYMSGAHRDSMIALAAEVLGGRDRSRPRAARAQSLWSAAQRLRAEGMALVGTELAPDAAIFDGNFEDWSVDAVRDERRAGKLLHPDPDESARALAHGPDPDRRFHYRFVAADLAWDAAALMPDDDPLTAAVLCTAGQWLMYRDPDAANRFYRALVRRCGSTPIGADAARRRWFPKPE